MNNLSDSATKKRDLLSKTSDDASEFKWGFDAGYEVGREEMNQQVQLLEDALIKVGAYFDCLSCESQHGYVCEHHLDERMQAAIKALESLSQLRGGGKNTVEGIIEKYKPIQEVLKELENED